MDEQFPGPINQPAGQEDQEQIAPTKELADVSGDGMITHFNPNLAKHTVHNLLAKRSLFENVKPHSLNMDLSDTHFGRGWSKQRFGTTEHGTGIDVKQLRYETHLVDEPGFSHISERQRGTVIGVESHKAGAPRRRVEWFIPEDSPSQLKPEDVREHVVILQEGKDPTTIERTDPRFNIAVQEIGYYLQAPVSWKEPSAPEAQVA